MTTSPRVALYIRVSSEEQVAHGYSLEAQKEALIEYANNHNMTIVDIYADEGISGKRPASKRPSMMRMFNDLDSKKIDQILFIKLDRWFRSVKLYYQAQEILEKHNVTWRAILEDYNTDSADGILKVNIMLSVAQNEAERTGERIKFIFDSKIKRKEPISGSQPWGYKIDIVDGKKCIIKDPEVAHMVDDMFNSFFKYRSIQTTNRYMNDKYGLSRARTITANLLQHPAYTGEYRGIINYRPPYITKEQHEEILQTAKNSSRYDRKTKSVKRVYLFTGLIKCPECGHNLSATFRWNRPHTKAVKYYRCVRHVDRRCGYTKALPETKMEQYLLENIKPKFDEYSKKIELSEKTKRSSKNPIKYEERLKRLNNAYIMGNIPEDDYITMSTNLKNSIEKIKAENKPSMTKDFKALKKIITDDFEDLYNTLDDERKKNLWTSIIKEIHIDDITPVDIIFL